MSATGPTTRSAHSARKLREPLLDSNSSRLRFLARGDPANPLVARERRYVFPQRTCLRRLHERLSQIIRHFVYCATREFFFGHEGSISKLLLGDWYDVQTAIDQTEA